MTALMLAAAQTLALMGWPVMPIKPNSKEPLTRHGVKDATTDERKILHWFDRWPDANLAIATGLPGPNVLDVDNPAAAKPVLAQLKRIGAPEVATARAFHLYFKGTTSGTVTLEFGELRARGSYVVVPPSIHPSGKEYVWTHSPNGSLPPLPDFLAAVTTKTAGTGTFEPVELIGHGQRHDALKDAAVRFLRGGFTDPAVLEAMIEAFFRARCDPRPPPRKDEFRKIAQWAARTDIARRERELETATPLAADKPKPKTQTTKKGQLEKPPHGDAPLADHRAYVRTAGGWPEPVDIKTVRRHGVRGADALEIDLTNGQQIAFERQDQVTTRGHWPKTVVMCTNGIADPTGLTEWEAVRVLRSLCILADAPVERREADELRDALRDFLELTEAVDEHDLSTQEGRYDLIARCRARKQWDPRKPDPDVHPVLIVSRADGARCVRAGELRDYLIARGLGIAWNALPGRMAMTGLAVQNLHGREPARPDREGRQTNHMRVYQLPEDLT